MPKNITMIQENLNYVSQSLTQVSYQVIHCAAALIPFGVWKELQGNLIPDMCVKSLIQPDTPWLEHNATVREWTIHLSPWSTLSSSRYSASAHKNIRQTKITKFIFERTNQIEENSGAVALYITDGIHIKKRVLSWQEMCTHDVALDYRWISACEIWFAFSQVFRKLG